MRKKGFVAALLVVVLGCGLAAAQCPCEEPASGIPPCYTAFCACEEVRFKLVVPADYFFYCPTCEAPLITGWRIETAEGAVIYQETFPETPKGHWYVMTWEQKDTYGNVAATGFYKIVVQTTTAGEFENVIHIAATPCCGGWRSCYPFLRSHPCGIALCQPYVKLIRAERCWRSCGFFSISVHIGVNCCP